MTRPTARGRGREARNSRVTVGQMVRPSTAPLCSLHHTHTRETLPVARRLLGRKAPSSLERHPCSTDFAPRSRPSPPSACSRPAVATRPRPPARQGGGSRGRLRPGQGGRRGLRQVQRDERPGAHRRARRVRRGGGPAQRLHVQHGHGRPDRRLRRRVRHRRQQLPRQLRDGAPAPPAGGRGRLLRRRHLRDQRLELGVAAQEGLLYPYKSELRDSVLEAGRKAEDWTATRFNVFVIGWNTDKVKADEVPKSLEELAEPQWKGRVSMELGDVDWFTPCTTTTSRSRGSRRRSSPTS